MKFIDYPSATTLTEDNILLIDGDAGTKKMSAADFVLNALSLNSVYNRRMTFRGKNLGSSLTSEQKLNIQNGTFEGLHLGDYWEINGVKWRIADFDYWYNCGDSKFTNHHLVIMPDTGLANGKMNGTSTTTGGYTGSQMYTTNMATAKASVNSAFPSAVLTHREYLINTVTSGYPSNGTWTDSSIELPNEIMIFGSYINTPSSDGTTSVKRYSASNTQLALFMVHPSFQISGNGFWLRDIGSATHFCRVDAYGGATLTGAANEFPIRPVFPIG